MLCALAIFVSGAGVLAAGLLFLAYYLAVGRDAITNAQQFSLAIVFLLGLVDAIGETLRDTLVQLITPDHMRGRVASVNSIFIGSSNELGAFESGVAAKILGLVPSVVFGGCMTLSVVFTTMRLNKPLLRLSLKNRI